MVGNHFRAIMIDTGLENADIVDVIGLSEQIKTIRYLLVHEEVRN